MKPAVAAHVIYIGGAFTGLNAQLVRLFNPPIHFLRGLEQLVPSVVDVAFGVKAKDDFINGDVLPLFTHSLTEQERYTVIELYNGLVNTVVCTISNELMYTPNFILHDYRLLDDYYIAVAFREVTYGQNRVTVEGVECQIPEDF